MEEHDVAGELLTPIEDLSHGDERLLVGKMPLATHDAALQEDRPVAFELHARVIVALDRQHIHVAEMLDQPGRNAPQIGRISDATPEACDDETMRAQVIVLKPDRMDLKLLERREMPGIERLDQFRETAGGLVVGSVSKHAFQQVGVPVAMTEHSYSEANERVGPGGIEMIAIQVSQADG